MPHNTLYYFSKKHPNGLECSACSLSVRTESGYFDGYGLTQRDLWSCSRIDLFMLFKQFILIIQVMFDYILVTKNPSDKV